MTKKKLPNTVGALIEATLWGLKDVPEPKDSASALLYGRLSLVTWEKNRDLALIVALMDAIADICRTLGEHPNLMVREALLPAEMTATMEFNVAMWLSEFFDRRAPAEREAWDTVDQGEWSNVPRDLEPFVREMVPPPGLRWEHNRLVWPEDYAGTTPTSRMLAA